MESLNEFKVGDHATYILYTDQSAGYITSVSKNGRTVEFKEGKATLLNKDESTFSPGGFSGHTDFPNGQKWDIQPCETSGVRRFTARKAKRQVFNKDRRDYELKDVIIWKLVGHPSKSPGCCLIHGHHHQYDFNF